MFGIHVQSAGNRVSGTVLRSHIVDTLLFHVLLPDLNVLGTEGQQTIDYLSEIC